ncbi:MAG: Phenylalanine--tRNA ligase alpha subunit [Firmicutes bacterium ADurb.Bin080]|jgi:phenylalanyl-tRNA synthetase alpha chain|nr:phenylalanine--tRNA ligase subunit alpha [Clostridiales bacterium]OQC16446.1 MAG: Phenylalanine--tRNA ligase alpha subunit [Firmicutes bacterium ADurb.Bin080]
MEDSILALLDNAKKEIVASNSTSFVNEVRVKYIGRTGLLTSMLKDLKNFPSQDRPAIGKLLNDARIAIENLISQKTAELIVEEQKQKEYNETLDISLSLPSYKRGVLHPLSIVKNEIIDIFTGLGFSIEDGPEIELSKYNFELLNIPADHPSRAFCDSFYISDDILLRTQTSGIQARVMEKTLPPIKIICPGKVYRPDDDATHSPMFQQIEGLYVDKNVSLADLKSVLQLFAKKFFSESTKVRFRPSYFPFTEPSVEVDLSCAMCGGAGCSLCKGTGWLELLGAGVVNPIVLDNCGIDSSIYSGFAFGIGIERATMVKYGIPDMRILFDGDVRYIDQFR